MHRVIQKVFGLDKLYDRKYGWAFAIDISLLLLAIFLMNNFLQHTTLRKGVPGLVGGITYALLFATALYYIQELMQAVAIRKRLQSRNAIDLPLTEKPVASEVGVSAVSEEFESHPKTRPIRLHANSTVYDVRREYYRQTKYGSYKSKETYYTLFEYKLHRKLPNIVFDSKSAKGRQFSKLYVGAQKLQLEGNFSDVFDAYMPKHYHIDSLSFITPEVMHAMLDLRNNDIEINGDSLLIYAPLLSNQEIDTITPTIDNLYQTLNNNLESYRDERLDYAQGKKVVTQFGSKLLRSPKKYVPALVVSGIASATFIYFGIIEDPSILSHNLAYYCYIIFGYNLFVIVRLVRRNRKLEQEFRNHIEISKRVLAERSARTATK